MDICCIKDKRVWMFEYITFPYKVWSTILDVLRFYCKSAKYKYRWFSIDGWKNLEQHFIVLFFYFALTLFRPFMWSTNSQQGRCRKSMRCLNIEEGKRKKRKQRSSLLIGVRTYNFHRDELKKRMNRNIGYRTWQNRCFEKLDDHPIYTIPNHHPTTMDFLPKTSVKIILAAKWLVRHSSTSHKQQRRPYSFSSVCILLLCV